MSGDRLNNISFIKTIMMIIIVLYHSSLFFGEQWFQVVSPKCSADYLYQICKWMNTFHIQSFTMTSGFLFYYLKKEKGKYKNHKEDIKKEQKD